jgi:chloride channel protein, CIC family
LVKVYRSPLIERLSHWLGRRIERVEPPDSLVLVITAVIVGAGTGLGAVTFIWLLGQIAQFKTWLMGLFGPPLPEALALVLVMAAAGLIVGYLVNGWARETRGHGVPEVMEAVALRGGRIRTRVAAVKVIASSITIGSGGSAGREGPIVQVGSALGSTVGQMLRLSDDRVRTMVACGAAAGIAATFNAPIAGSIFALEVILGRFTTRYFGAVVISSVSAGIVARVFLGSEPAFSVPAYPLSHLPELLIYIVLGVLAALIAVLFIRVLYGTEALVDRWRPHPALKAAAGMALTAAVGGLVADGAVLGSGLDFIGESIAEDFSMPMALMALLLVLKLLATSLTLGSGNSGGVFAPALFMGAMLGGIVGNAAQALWPEVVLHPGAYAIVGMAAVFSGAARAPISAVLIVFEMSNDYHLILPLMMATVIATFLAEHLHGESIYTLKLRLRGITLQRGRDVDLMQGLLVREAMTATPYVVDQDMPLEELFAFFQQTHSHSFPVVDEGHRLVGMVSITDYDRASEQEALNDRRVRDIATMSNILVAYDHEPLSEALQRIGVRDVNKMPVVTREDPGRVVGVIRRRDIIRAYNTALSRRAREQADSDRWQMRHIDNTAFIEVHIPEDGPAVNQTLAALGTKLPDGCLVVSIRRQGSLLIPHGDTVVQAGDLVTVFLRRSDEAALRRCFLADGVQEATTNGTAA